MNIGGDPGSTLLKNCASDGKFVMLATANQIITTFRQIGTTLSQLRIAKQLRRRAPKQKPGQPAGLFELGSGSCAVTSRA